MLHRRGESRDRHQGLREHSNTVRVVRFTAGKVYAMVRLEIGH